MVELYQYSIAAALQVYFAGAQVSTVEGAGGSLAAGLVPAEHSEARMRHSRPRDHDVAAPAAAGGGAVQPARPRAGHRGAATPVQVSAPGVHVAFAPAGRG